MLVCGMSSMYVCVRVCERERDRVRCCEVLQPTLQQHVTLDFPVQNDSWHGPSSHFYEFFRIAFDCFWMRTWQISRGVTRVSDNVMLVLSRGSHRRLAHGKWNKLQQTTTFPRLPTSHKPIYVPSTTLPPFFIFNITLKGILLIRQRKPECHTFSLGLHLM